MTTKEKILFTTLHFTEGVERFFSSLFSRMMQEKYLTADDPTFLAFEFVAPVSELVHLCDREPQKEKECLHKAEWHVDRFVSLHAKNV